MSQYTDKINQIAKDFAYIEEMEGTSSISAYNGQFRIMYKHGGERIEIVRDDIEVDGKLYNKGEVIITKPIDSYYIKLKEKYGGTNPTWKDQINNWFANIKKRFLKNDCNRSFWKS